ncbi:MAG: YdcF family protein [Oscillospiraceae bacterium]|nr:YdcF family protein [Oscillospiraceae bacterium]
MNYRAKQRRKGTLYHRYGGRRKKTWLWILGGLLVFGLLCFGSLVAAVALGTRSQTAGQPQAVVILGCKVEENGAPSVLLQDRLDTALDYLNTHPDLPVVVSGGQGKDEPVSEAACMAAYLTQAGIAADRIALEDNSHSTWDNLNETAEVLSAQGIDPREGVLLVSNGFHLTRVRMLAQRCGFEASTLAAPASHSGAAVHMFFRETLALVKSFLLDR